MQAGFLKKEAVVAAIPAEALEAKFELCLTACAALRSKPADEEEPYVFRYEERDALQQLLKQAAANAAVEPDGADAARARVIGGVLECWLGVNFMDTEEPGSGQARLERAIEALDTEVAPAEAVRLLDALNHLGVLWANRGESEKSLERLEAAEVLHKSLRSGSGVTELREGEEQLEDLHTLTCFYLAQACLTASHLTALPYLTLPYLTVYRTPTHLTPPHPTSPRLTPPHLPSPHLPCFYLAQAHGNLGARDRSAAYCHTTMMRQLARRGGSGRGEHAFQAGEWAKNAQQIAAYYASGALPSYHP